MQSTRTSDAHMLRTPVSCCIITKNESDRIERCILSLRDIVDEIVVVDSGSEDDTVAKATSLGAKVFFNAWEGFGPQKRHARQTTGFSILMLTKSLHRSLRRRSPP